MTAEELAARLQALPPGIVIVIYSAPDGKPCEAEGVEILKAGYAFDHEVAVIR